MLTLSLGALLASVIISTLIFRSTYMEERQYLRDRDKEEPKTLGVLDYTVRTLQGNYAGQVSFSVLAVSFVACLLAWIF